LAEHDELAGHQIEVRQAIELAQESRGDLDFGHRDIHYRHTGRGAFRLRVIVHFRPTESGGWVGEVVTAFLSRRRAREEQIKWP
jgi:hypothetical protein